jgi:hypothetical protein
MQKENTSTNEGFQYVGPYRLEKTLGKGQTGECLKFFLVTFLKQELLNLIGLVGLEIKGSGFLCV